MKNIFKTLFFATVLSVTIAACGSNKSSESSESTTDSAATTESNVGDTAVVVDNDSLSNPPTVVDSLKK